MPSRARSTGEGDADVVAVESLAHELTETLDLPREPVALAFVADHPDGVPVFRGEVPSACTFWRRAEEGVFVAPAGAHLNCLVGALTMGFPLSDDASRRLMGLVGRMVQVGYLDADEARHIPTVPGETSAIVYGPLKEFPLEPDLVLVWVSGTATMLLGEAVGAARWTADGAGLTTFGRPSCAALAVAVQGGAPVLTAGCLGMRTFTGVDPALSLMALPRAVLPGLEERLRATVRANGTMAPYYAEQRERFSPAGSRP
jgi:uncharacterized protein (DUF169 family)